MHNRILTGALLAALVFAVSGCSFSAGGKPTYKTSGSLPPLEIPPELTAPVRQGEADLPELDTPTGEMPVSGQGGAVVLPARANIEVGGHGPMRWLVIDGTAAQVWEGVLQFLQAQGFELKVQEPSIGVIETQWAERRPEVPEVGVRGALARAFSGFYGIPYRDKFRVRLEPAGDGRTELYLTHYGVEQVVAEDRSADERAVWRVRPSDPELANEMLNRLMVFLGVEESQAATKLAAADEADARARLVTDQSGQPSVLVQDDFARAWRRTGIALDRIGLVVEDRNRAEGVYYVRQVDQVGDAGGKGEKGFFSRLFSRDDGKGAVVEKAQVALVAEGNNSRITLRGEDGKPVASDVAAAVLERLARQLR